MSEQPGVVVTPPHLIGDSIKRHVEATLGTIPPGKGHVAELSITLESGVNVAYAARIHDGPRAGEWDVVAYVGKNWNGPIQGGVNVRWIK
jgi:hypothetical protein